jgi:AraC family transcriptional regulator
LNLCRASGGGSEQPVAPRPRLVTDPMEPIDDGGSGATRPALRFSSAGAARRRSLSRGPLTGKLIQLVRPGLFEAQFRASVHLLIAIDRGERHDGETFVEGLPRSRLRAIRQKLIFVPAGRRFHDWQDSRILPRLFCLYLDPHWCMAESGLEFEPRLFFDDTDLWATARKLTRQIERGQGADALYVDALGLLLRRELIRLNGGLPSAEPPRLGALADWQARLAAEYVEAHLGEQISLAALASIARLSQHHFARAFKRSFGMPPHRYHTMRRIERAKNLLARRGLSITEIALEVGFGQSSSFTLAFRQLVGRTPSGYRGSIS